MRGTQTVARPARVDCTLRPAALSGGPLAPGAVKFARGGARQGCTSSLHAAVSTLHAPVSSAPGEAHVRRCLNWGGARGLAPGCPFAPVLRPLAALTGASVPT